MTETGNVAMKTARIIALLCAFNAAGAFAQPASSFLVINNTKLILLCSTRMPNGLWENWFEMQPAVNWTRPGADQIQFQCRPPVAQVSYTLRPGDRYSLLQEGAEIRLVQISSGR